MAEKKKTSNKGGRPKTELTAKQAGQVEALASVLNIQQIADYFGISEKTFDRILERDPNVLSLYKKGRQKAVKDVGKGLLQKAKEGNIVAQMFYLKTQAGWKETQAFEHSGPEGKPIESETQIKLDDFPKTQRRTLINLYRKLHGQSKE